MKKLIVLSCFLIIGLCLFAQTPRIAIINSERIMLEAADTQEAHRLFAIDIQNWDRQIEALTAEIDRLQNDLDTQRLLMPETRRREAEERITQRRRDRAQMVERVYGERGEASRREAELLAPIMEKLRVVIDTVAQEDGYHMVIDRTNGGVVWAMEHLDITQRVIIEMNRMR